MRTVLFLAPLLAAGCLRAAPPVPTVSESLPHRTTPAAATLAATEGLEDVGLAVTANGSSLSSTWRSPLPPTTRLAPWRRVQLRVRIDPAQVVVRPLAEECDAAGCTPVAGLLADEATLVRNAIEAIRERLDAAQAVQPVAAIERQATRDPEPPAGRGPAVVLTRAGAVEVAAGWQIDAELVNGSRVSGRVVAVSADGVSVEVSPGQEVVLWSGDLASIRVR